MLPNFTAPQCDFTEFYRSPVRFYRILPLSSALLLLPNAILPNFTAPQRDFTEFYPLSPVRFTISGAGCVAAGLVASAALVAAGGLIVYVHE